MQSTITTFLRLGQIGFVFFVCAWFHHERFMQ